MQVFNQQCYGEAMNELNLVICIGGGGGGGEKEEGRLVGIFQLTATYMVRSVNDIIILP